MEKNFKDALNHVLVHEGGWSDHPVDPGGATMKGVTLRTYRRFFGQDKSKNDLRNISDRELEHIYRSGYWDKSRCDDLPLGVDYAVFDAAVNSGPRRGAKWLQFAVGAKQDGEIGPKTLDCLEKHEPSEVIHDMCDRRLTFLRGLSHWPTFGRGWSRRVEGVRVTATAMAGGNSSATPSTTVDFEIVRNGSTGPWVHKLQQALEIQVDGIFGNATEAALKAWQKEVGLEPDGIAGPKTYKALGLIP
jgi:lysozyme family protein